MTITLRPLHQDDIPALAKLHAEIEAVDDTGEHYNEQDLEEEFADPHLELGKDVVGAFEGDQLVGFYSVMARSDPGQRVVIAFGATLPDHRGRGIGTVLADAMLARAQEIRQREESPLRVLLFGRADDGVQEDLLARVGMVPERWQFGMKIDLGAVPPAPPLPDGYSLRLMKPDDADRMREAHNRAFRDNPDFSLWTTSEWKQWVTGSRNFRPELTFLVHPEGTPDEIAGYVQTYEYDAVLQATGRRQAYVARVGTVPGHRGKGLATILLQHCLVAYQDAGYDEAALDVDSMNPSGALGIYERAGFTTERRFASYATVLS